MLYSTVSAITGSDVGDEFILLPLNGNHSESVFDDVENLECYDENVIGFNVNTNIINKTKSSSQTVNFCDCPPSNFIERGRVMQEIFRSFVDSHRCVTIQGARGNLYLTITITIIIINFIIAAIIIDIIIDITIFSEATINII